MFNTFLPSNSIFILATYYSFSILNNSILEFTSFDKILNFTSSKDIYLNLSSEACARYIGD